LIVEQKGATTMVGYATGSGYTNLAQTPIFSSLSPVILGNGLSATITEAVNSYIDDKRKPSSSINNGPEK